MAARRSLALHIYFMKNIKQIVVLLSLLLMSACRTAPVPASETPYTVINKISSATPPAVEVHNPNNPLTVHPWKLKQATDSKGQRIAALFVDANRPLTLEFHHGSVRISNTCNAMSGAYTLDSANNALNISPLIGTMMACPQPLMALDATIAHHLKGALQLSIEDSELRIQNATGDILVFGE